MRNLAFVLAASLCACSSPRPSAPGSPEREAPAATRVHALDAAHAGGPISLADWTPAEGLFAVGTLSDGRGEVTIDDGEVWISRPPDLAAPGVPQVRTERTSESTEPCAQLVAARVDEWIELQISEDLAWVQLGPKIEVLAGSAGIDVTEPFPIRIYGGFNDVTWRVDSTLRPAGQIEGAMVGFYSRRPEAILAGDDVLLHLHVLWPSSILDVSGHVLETGLKAGSLIALPAWKSKR